MNIARKIKQSVQDATEMKCLYGTRENINEQISSKGLPCAFFTLLGDSNITEGAGTLAESYTLTMVFARSTEYNFGAYENEDIIEQCRADAIKWLAYLRAGNAEFTAGAITRAGRVYEEFDDVVTGYYLTIIITSNPQCLQ